MPMISKRIPEMVPAATVPELISMSSSARITSKRSSIDDNSRPIPAATTATTDPHPRLRLPGDNSSDCVGSDLPNPMISNIVNGLSHVA